MHLRKLREEDAEGMLEWMHESDAQEHFRFNSEAMTRADAVFFIQHSFSETVQHYAIADDSDVHYLGTVSLKDIDRKNGTAEYAMSLRSSARQKGFGTEATKRILRIAFKELRLHRVWLTVVDNNTAACLMYEKCGFRLEGIMRDHLLIHGERRNWKIYGILAEEYAGE